MASQVFTVSNGERPFWPRRLWWLALLVILALAGALRFTGYDFGLPYVEHVAGRADEIPHSLAARLVIDTGTAKSLDMHHYPPGNIALNYLALRLFQDPADPPAIVMRGLRLLAVGVSLATVAVLALLGYHAGGPVASLISAGIWSITPVMVEYSRYASADIYHIFFVSLAVGMTLVGTLRARSGITTAAIYMLMLAVVFKYTPLFMAPLLLVAPLYAGRMNRGVVLGNIARFALFSAWLLLLTPLLEAFQAEEISQSVDFAWMRNHLDDFRFPGIAQVFAVFQNLQSELHLLSLLPGWLGLVLITRRGGKNDAFALALLSLSALAGLLGVSLFNEHSIRFVLPSISLLIVLAGMGYALWWQFLQRRFFAHLSPPRRKLAAALALLALLVLNLPNAWTTLNDTRRLTLPDRRNDLAHWADSSLPASSYITNYDNHRTLNREWGGYAGETRFDYAGNVYSDTTIGEWRARGVLFAIVPHFQYRLWREEGSDEFVTETTLLKSYPRADAYRDPGMVVLLLHPIPHEATGQLGPIRLIGYELDEGNPRPGDALPFHLYWQVAAPTKADYQVFNHLLDSEGRLVAQIDGPPLPDPLLRRGTSAWDDPEEIIYSRKYILSLPEDLPPGEYSLVTGFYQHDTGQRLFTPTGEDALWVARIVVE